MYLYPSNCPRTQKNKKRWKNDYTCLPYLPSGGTLCPHRNYPKNTKREKKRKITTSAYPICFRGAQCTHTAVIALKTQKNEKNQKIICVFSADSFTGFSFCRHLSLKFLLYEKDGVFGDRFDVLWCNCNVMHHKHIVKASCWIYSIIRGFGKLHIVFNVFLFSFFIEILFQALLSSRKNPFMKFQPGNEYFFPF